jgi:N-acetylglucosaminyl-diphospho-decaprenol L-rhamnosyltransferase
MIFQIMEAYNPAAQLARVAVVTVSYGSGKVLDGLLPSLANACAQPSVVIIVDNKSTDADNVANLARANSAVYIPMSTNVGYGSAVNAAVRDLPPHVEWVLIANPDIVMSPGSLDVLVDTGNSDPMIASVGPLTLTSEGEVYPSARVVPSLRTGVGHALLANLWSDNPWSRAYKRDFDSAKARRDAGWLSGACVLVRRAVFDSVGGFDENYFMYFEDVDLGYRFGKAGYRNVFEPAAVVTHSGAHSTSTTPTRMIASHHASARRFLNKKYSRAIFWPLRVVLSVGLSLRSTIVRRGIRRTGLR